MVMVHKPVMCKEVVNYLNLKTGAVVVDATVGTGGHAFEILKNISDVRLIGVDRDAESLEVAKERFSSLKAKVDFVHDDFRNIDHILNNLKINEVDAIFFDLGISSYQLDLSERGFSLQKDGPLDMRMDRSSYICAYDLVNNLTRDEIASILYNFGQERFSRKIAAQLVRERVNHPIATTAQLTQTVLRALPFSYHSYGRIHPATRTFQAFRIAVNRELEALDEALKKAIDFLKVNGRICVISFHSLEDRIVKDTFRQFQRAGILELITRKPLPASGDELNQNPRSRSAKLRVAKKVK